MTVAWFMIGLACGFSITLIGQMILFDMMKKVEIDESFARKRYDRFYANHVTTHPTSNEFKAICYLRKAMLESADGDNSVWSNEFEKCDAILRGDDDESRS